MSFLFRKRGKLPRKKGGSPPSLHKVIMVGSGGVGKSALTLQVMSNLCFVYKGLTYNRFSLCMTSLWRITNLQKLTHTERKSCWMGRRFVHKLLIDQLIMSELISGSNKHLRHGGTGGLCSHQGQLLQKWGRIPLRFLNNRG